MKGEITKVRTWQDDIELDRLVVADSHAVDRRRVKDLVASMLQHGGWAGSPVLLAEWYNGAEYHRVVLDGHHRIAAAQDLWRHNAEWCYQHMPTIPAVLVDGDALDAATDGDWPTRLEDLDDYIDYHDRA